VKGRGEAIGKHTHAQTRFRIRMFQGCRAGRRAAPPSEIVTRSAFHIETLNMCTGSAKTCRFS